MLFFIYFLFPGNSESCDSFSSGSSTIQFQLEGFGLGRELQIKTVLITKQRISQCRILYKVDIPPELYIDERELLDLMPTYEFVFPEHTMSTKTVYALNKKSFISTFNIKDVLHLKLHLYPPSKDKISGIQFQQPSIAIDCKGIARNNCSTLVVPKDKRLKPVSRNWVVISTTKKPIEIDVFRIPATDLDYDFKARIECMSKTMEKRDVTEEATSSFQVSKDSITETGARKFEEDEHPPLEARHLNMIHEELEKLNISTDVINKMEVQLDQARADFRETHVHWSEKLKELSKQYCNQIAKARPFYELKVEERTLREESQKAAERFERATSILAVAKKQVSLTQESLSRQTSILPECLEVLNHHIQRVREVEEERSVAESVHAAKAHSMLHLAEKIRVMEKTNRSAIKKSRLYFEKRLEFTKILEEQKKTILCLEAEVRIKKNDYTASLRNLEKISEQIHEERSTGFPEGTNQTDEHPDSDSPEKSGNDDIPGNPPPYAPTAPPPYDDKYLIEKDDDSIVLNMMKAEQEEKNEQQTMRSLGSGVILLAQQLIRSGTEKHHPTPARHENEDAISYKTRPIGLSDGSDNSEVSSLSSFHIGDDDTVSKMLMSHSELIKDIESATDRVGHILKPAMKSVSDVNE
ncbi:unnamed protein product [Caenorhabditis sp. 36 PRJEB53466]|nr:unnamed protein product [Caenorhabditis sp. 36 PRJEB53466]